MRKSWAEYKRISRKRQREERRKQGDVSLSELRRSYFEYFLERGHFDPGWFADVIGDEWHTFKDDSGLKPFTADALAEEDLSKASNSLEKAEFLISIFMDLAGEFAESVSRFKRDELSARIAQIESSNLSQPEEKRKAALEINKLRKMRDQLEKQVRWTLPQWKVTGE